MAYLIVKSGLAEGQRFDIIDTETTIGRAGGVQVRIKDKGVSRRHAIINRRSDKSYYIALASPGLRLLVDRKLVKMSDLKDKSMINIGGALLQFHLNPQEKEAAEKSDRAPTVLDVFQEQRTAKQSEDEDTKLTVSKTQLKVILGSVAAFIIIAAFFIAVGSYEPDEQQALDGATKMAQKIADSGAVNIKPGALGNKKEKKNKIVGYYEDENEKQLNISGGPKPKGHIKFGSDNKLTKQQKEAVEASNKKKAAAQSPSSKSSGGGTGKKGKLPTQGGGTIETGDVGAPGGKGGGGGAKAGGGGGGGGGLNMGGGGSGKIKTGNVSGGGGGASPDIPDSDGTGGENDIPEGDGEGAEIQAGDVTGGDEDKDIDQMLDEKQEDMEKADDLNLEQFEGKGKLDRDQIKAFNPTGSKKKKKKKKGLNLDFDRELAAGQYFMIVDTFEMLTQGEIGLAMDHNGGFVIAWVLGDYILGQRLDFNGVQWETPYMITGWDSEVLDGMPEVSGSPVAGFFVAWEPLKSDYPILF